jgi:ATP-dependent Clp protease ATP-binding subunit ClpA
MLGNEFLSRFTGHLREALQHALAFAISSGRDAVDPGDLLVGLLQQQGSIAAELLNKSNVDAKKAESAFRGFPKPHEPGGPIAPDLSPAVRRILEKCVLMAHVHEHRYVGTEHLLLSLLESTLPDVHTFLESHGMNLDLAKEQLVHILRNTSRFPDLLAREEVGSLPLLGRIQRWRLRLTRHRIRLQINRSMAASHATNVRVRLKSLHGNSRLRTQSQISIL